MSNEITILRARTVHTMDPAHSGDAIAVRDGRIEAVGAFEALRGARPAAVVDGRYGDDVLMPGFVEAHCHPMAGAFWLHTYVGFYDRRDPDGVVWPGCRSLDDVIERLRTADAALDDPDAALIAWGLDPIYFSGDRLVADHLDRVSATRPIIVVHASIHLATVNRALMAAQGIDRDTLAEGVPKDATGEPIGELQEPAAMALAGQPFFDAFKGVRSPEGIEAFGRLARNAGITTMTDLGNGLANDDVVDFWIEQTGRAAFPARVSIFHSPMFGHVDDLAALMKAREAQSTDKVRFGSVKFVLDGSIQGFTARVTEPYLDGTPNGIWVLPPAQVQELLPQVVGAGLLLHVHCNGDEAVDLLLDAMGRADAAGLLGADHRTTVQHSQLTRRDQYERMTELGMSVNLFSNHLWYWGDQHVDRIIGPERAARMNAARTVLDLGLPLSVHSDAAVTPLGSLHVAWCAVNRRTPSGRVVGPNERITVPEAMAAITMGAARQLRLDDEIGSITPGKRADLAVLAEDPFAVDPEALRDVEVRGTVLGGAHHPADG